MGTLIVVVVLAGCLAGAGLGWLVAANRMAVVQTAAALRTAALESEIVQLRENARVRDKELAAERARIEEERKNASDAREALAALRAGTQAEKRAAEQQVASLLEVEQRLKDSFETLAGSALDANSRRLLQLNAQQLRNQQDEAKQDLSAKEIAIKNLLLPMQESLAKLETHSRELEVSRAGAYESVLAEINNIQRSHVDLRRETTQLVQALRAPKIRGNWGEMQLRRCVEFAGMVRHASFEVEQFVRGEEVAVRPDLVVKLPNGRCIIVDAKTPLESFLQATGCEDEVQRTIYMVAHARQVRTHLAALSGKAYSKQFAESPDFIVCFLPSEVLFSAALEHDPSLIEYSAKSNVLLATPTTLIALLKAVACGWQQAQIARDAEKIKDEAIKVQYKLAGMHGAILDLGKRLRAAGDSYDDMLVKAEGRGGLFSISRRLRELNVGDGDLPETKAVALRPKQMAADEWQGSLSLAAVEGEERQ